MCSTSISSSVRLAEAVVTEIVHAEGDLRAPTGGRSFALLRVFSESNPLYDIPLEGRASPFGEHPIAFHLSNLETIGDGVMLFTTVLVCFVLLMILALVGITWPLSLRSGIEIDIYNRDGLIRAVPWWVQQTVPNTHLRCASS